MRPPTRTAPAPVTVVAMQPTIVARPFHVEGFVYEENVNGYRIVAYKQGRGGEEEGVMSADNRRIDGSNDDFALLRRLLAEAVEEGRLRGYRARHAS